MKSQKEILRTQILCSRKTQKIKPISHFCILLRLWKFILSSRIKKILVYSPLLGEVNLTPLYHSLLKLDFQLFFPVTSTDRDMDFFKCTHLHELTNKGSSPPEPIPDNKCLFTNEDSATAIIIIPSLLVDKQGYRLGFGKGYYDRYLQRFPNLIRVAPQFSEFILEKLPSDPWDIAVQLIISEKENFNLDK